MSLQKVLTDKPRDKRDKRPIWRKDSNEDGVRESSNQETSVDFMDELVSSLIRRRNKGQRDRR
jgi:hypothetical protein